MSSTVQYWGVESSEHLQLQRARALKRTQQYSKELVISQHLIMWKVENTFHFTFWCMAFPVHKFSNEYVSLLFLSVYGGRVLSKYLQFCQEIEPNFKNFV